MPEGGSEVKKPFATARRTAGTLYQTARWTRTARAFLVGRRCIDCGTTLRLQADHEPAWQPHEGVEAFFDPRRLVPRCHTHHASKSGRDASRRAHGVDDPKPRTVTAW